MSRRNPAPVIRDHRRRRRGTTLLWIAVLAAVIIALLVSQQTALLYVLSTLGVTVLLVMVAMADLDGSRLAARSSAPADDAAAIGSGLVDPTAPTATAAAASAELPPSARS